MLNWVFEAPEIDFEHDFGHTGFPGRDACPEVAIWIQIW